MGAERRVSPMLTPLMEEDQSTPSTHPERRNAKQNAWRFSELRWGSGNPPVNSSLQPD